MIFNKKHTGIPHILYPRLNQFFFVYEYKNLTNNKFEHINVTKIADEQEFCLINFRKIELNSLIFLNSLIGIYISAIVIETSRSLFIQKFNLVPPLLSTSTSYKINIRHTVAGILVEIFLGKES